MGRKIIGILIIIIGLAALSGLVSVMFFRLDPWAMFRARFFPADSPAPDQPRPEPDSPAASSAPPVVPAAGRPQPVRTVVVDDSLLDGQPGAADQAPAFRPAAETRESELLSMASAFIERFGTYSNQSNFSNVIDLKMFMSADMRAWADGYIADMRAGQGDTSLYYGITTRAISQKMVSLDEDTGEAKAVISTRRQEATGFTANISRSFNQDIVVVLVKENQSWKVDSAFWQ